ncbi:hypothetical protein WR25_05025 [Diploscapter pachys]|uniref:Doublecortin domain-containing protein n=1 Tax=Diploscapter pachys TaxID=2018661 RepID=A0A2A2J556_9BILA|nr:hypothetical protein WR25_05025 [Diploscapter pachys]
MPSTHSSRESRSRSRKPPRDEYHGQISAKKINVFKNGDPYHKGIKVVITSRMHDFDVLLNTISEKIDLSHGAKRIFTTAGKQVKAIKDLEDGKDYVASSGHFSPLKYGSNPIARKPRSPSRKKREKKSTDERPDTVRTTQSTQPRPKKKKKVPKKRAHSTSPRLEKFTPSDTVVSDTIKKVKHTGKKLRETANNAAHDGNEVVKKKVKKVKKSTKSAAEKAAKIPSAVAAGAAGAVSGAIVGASEKMTGREKAKERKHTPSPTRTHSITPRSAHHSPVKPKSRDSYHSPEPKPRSRRNSANKEENLPSDEENKGDERPESRMSKRESKENSRPSSRGSEHESEHSEHFGSGSEASEEEEEKEERVMEEKHSRRGSHVSNHSTHNHKEEAHEKIHERPSSRRQSRVVEQRRESLKKNGKAGGTNWGDLSSFTKNIESLLRK